MMMCYDNCSSCPEEASPLERKSAIARIGTHDCRQLVVSTYPRPQIGGFFHIGGFAEWKSHRLWRTVILWLLPTF